MLVTTEPGVVSPTHQPPPPATESAMACGQFVYAGLTELGFPQAPSDCYQGQFSKWQVDFSSDTNRPAHCCA